MAHLVAPHGGGDLHPVLAPAGQRGAALDRARRLPKMPMTSREVSDLLMLGMGAYTPLDGFMDHATWRRVCTEMKTADGTFWPVPITLSTSEDIAAGVEPGHEVALVDATSGAVMGTLAVTEKYRIDRKLEAESVFRTLDEKHPGVAKVLAQGSVNLAGRVTALSEGEYPERYRELYMRPAESRTRFAELGWSKVAAFQTRNPMHRSHEYLVRVAAEICDGVFIHQVLGALKEGDIPADVRTRAIDALIRNYFKPGICIQAGYPIEMRYAGPREALLHAVIRQNFGCSHLIVGRDHAGVGKYYGPFDAQRIFDDLWPGALILQPLKLDVTYYSRRCQSIVSARTSPPLGDDDRIDISGTRLREMLANGEAVPEEFSRPEVVEVLRAYYLSQTKGVAA
ncbi:MAG: sulfate adenylyltransferase [Alphaproteobacteria bacterium]|nr:sulfate adenylyltransferase [Alphaproteobacteria bacterium]